MKKSLSALSAPVSAPSAFSFCIPADCREADYALLLADRYMRWFEGFDPYGVEFDNRAAVLLESAAALLRGGENAEDMTAQLADALNEFGEDEHENDLFCDGSAILEDIRAYLNAGEIVEPSKPEPFYTGGGIWLCGMYSNDPHIYYIISTEDDFDTEGPYLSVYDDRHDDDPSGFCCQGYVGTIEGKDFTSYHKDAFDAMSKVLADAIN